MFSKAAEWMKHNADVFEQQHVPRGVQRVSLLKGWIKNVLYRCSIEASFQGINNETLTGNESLDIGDIYKLYPSTYTAAEAHRQVGNTMLKNPWLAGCQQLVVPHVCGVRPVFEIRDDHAADYEAIQAISFDAVENSALHVVRHIPPERDVELQGRLVQ